MNKEEMTWAIVFIKDCVAKVGEKMPFDNRTKEVAAELLDKVHKEILNGERKMADEEQTKKTWLEELNSKISPNAKGLDFKVKETAIEVCKKILEETKKMWQKDSDYFSDLEGIIKDLGVEV